jgi:uncharacterized protein
MHLKTRALPIALVVVAVAAGAALLTGAIRTDDSGARAAETDTTRTVSVTGEGHVTLTPDTVYMTVGVDMVAPELGAAQSQAATTMDAVIAALQAQGIAQQDIQTANYSIYVDRDYNQASQPITGYHVTHTVTVKVHDVNAAGDTIAAAVDAGANNIGGIWFGVEDQAGAIAQARELAVADATAKATDLARLTDSTLGPVLSISETTSGSTPVAYNALAATDKAAGVAINPGQTDIVLDVQVTYALN